MNIETVLAIFGGVQTVLVGLVAWFGKLWLERINRVENAILQHRVYLNKVQYDRECRIYNELWSALINVKELIRRIIEPETAAKRTSGPHEESLRQETTAAIETLFGVIEKHKPFFPELIWQKVWCYRELTSHWIQCSSEANDVWGSWLLTEGFKFLNQIRTAEEEVCEAIRARITAPVIG
jgi:hypothetical protein